MCKQGLNTMAYFANGSEGETLEVQCDDCPIMARGPETLCPVMNVHLAFNYDQVGNNDLRDAMSMLVSDETHECQVRKLLIPEDTLCGDKDSGD